MCDPAVVCGRPPAQQPGYERLCCLRCIQPKDHSFGTTCICRVPAHKMEAGRNVECVHCGCRGCASGDKGKAKPATSAAAPARAGGPSAGAGGGGGGSGAAAAAGEGEGEEEDM